MLTVLNPSRRAASTSLRAPCWNHSVSKLLFPPLPSLLPSLLSSLFFFLPSPSSLFLSSFPLLPSSPLPLSLSSPLSLVLSPTLPPSLSLYLFHTEGCPAGSGLVQARWNGRSREWLAQGGG